MSAADQREAAWRTTERRRYKLERSVRLYDAATVLKPKCVYCGSSRVKPGSAPLTCGYCADLPGCEPL